MYTNYNRETGIRYGMIAMQSLDPDLYNDLMNLPNPSQDSAFREYLIDFIDNAGVDLTEEQMLEFEKAQEDPDTTILQELAESIGSEIEDRFWGGSVSDDFWDAYDEGDVGAEGVIDGVTVHLADLGGAHVLWVFDSPHVGKYRECSPCVPGAGDLDSPDPEHGVETYDVPADWRYDPEA